jgi:hypothetical protein
LAGRKLGRPWRDQLKRRRRNTRAGPGFAGRQGRPRPQDCQRHQCGGRKTYMERDPELVKAAKALSEQRPRLSLRPPDRGEAGRTRLCRQGRPAVSGNERAKHDCGVSRGPDLPTATGQGEWSAVAGATHPCVAGLLGRVPTRPGQFRLRIWRGEGVFEQPWGLLTGPFIAHFDLFEFTRGRRRRRIALIKS